MRRYGIYATKDGAATPESGATKDYTDPLAGSGKGLKFVRGEGFVETDTEPGDVDKSTGDQAKAIEEMRKEGRAPIALGAADDMVSEGGSVTPGAPVMRHFDSGATRHTDEGKLDYEGFLSPHVLKRYAEYMNDHRTQADDKVRGSDDWQQGIPLDVYMKSQLRHTFDQWEMHRRGDATTKEMEDTLCAVMFNVQGYLFAILKEKATHPVPEEKPHD